MYVCVDQLMKVKLRSARDLLEFEGPLDLKTRSIIRKSGTQNKYNIHYADNTFFIVSEISSA